MDTRLPQSRETEATLVQRAAFAYRCAYARSTESRLADDNGQDYLTLREDETALAFALCDGVGQSFFGDLAARQVGEALVDWLWQRAPTADDAQSLRLALTRRLNALAPEVAAQAQSISLPDDLSPLVHEVLEQKRQKGSHTTFVAGRIDMTTQRLVLVWLGDSVLRFWGTGGRERSAELGDTFRTESRWSSQSGVIGAVNVFLAPLTDVTRVVAYSDGLAAAADSLAASPANEQLDAVISDLAVSPTSDDISLLEVWLGAAPVAAPQRLPAPQDVQVAYRDGLLVLNWSPLPGATHYQVEVGNGGARRWQVDRPPQTLEIDAAKAVGAAARIRGWDDRGPGTWSAAVPLVVEVLEAPTQPAAVAPPAVPRPEVIAPPAPQSRRWLWLALPVAALLVLVCLVGAVLVLRGGIARGRLVRPTATLPVGMMDGPSRLVNTPTAAVTPTPLLPPSPTAPPTTTPWLTWTPAAAPTVTPTETETPTHTPTPLPSVTPQPPTADTPTLTATIEAAPTLSPPPGQTEPALITPSPPSGDLSPKPEEGGSLE
jgi:hypothetical protein